jgi:thioredoxin 1
MNEITWFDADSKNWDEVVLKSHIPVLVDFWTGKCPYCERLKPIFQELSKEYLGRVRFVKLNADEVGDIAACYGVMSVPMLKFFCGGREVYSFIGFVLKDELRKELNRMLERYGSCIRESTPIQKDPMFG